MKTKAIILLLFFLSSLFVSAQKQEPGKETKFPEAPDNTFAYDIYSDGKLFIHQPSIPGVAGNEGFKIKAGAEKVAQLVVGKINKGEMPPTVSIDEMKKLKAIP